MNNNLLTDVRAQLANYLGDAMSLEGFREWFAPATWDVDESHGIETQMLVHEIEHRIAEFTSGDWSEAELRAYLTKLIPESVFHTANKTSARIAGAFAAPLLSSANTIVSSEHPSFGTQRVFSLGSAPA